MKQLIRKATHQWDLRSSGENLDLDTPLTSLLHSANFQITLFGARIKIIDLHSGVHVSLKSAWTSEKMHSKKYT